MQLKSIFSVGLSALLIPSFALGDPTVSLVKCPAVPEAYAKMITSLSVLKTSIKQDASCEPVKKEVSSLENLLGERRQSVVDLIEKIKRNP